MDVKAIIARNLQDPVYFCRNFLEEWFPQEMPWVHRGMLAIMTRRCGFLPQYGEMDKIIRHFVWSPDPFAKKEDMVEHPIFQFVDGELHMIIAPFNAMMLPRSFSKTTLCNGKNVWKLVHNLTKFLLYVSESGTHATTQLGNIKRQLESNEMLLKVYGSLVGKKWTEDEIECSNGVYAVARGRGGQIRGLLKDGRRPDDITIDDMEDEESVRTDEQRKKAKSFLYKSVLPARARQNPDTTVTMLGTLLHKEAVLMTVSRDPRFNFVKFSAIDRDGDALWSGNMTLEQVETEKQAAIMAGELEAFYLEIMSELSDASTAPFKRIIHLALPLDAIVNGVGMAVDPAISEEKKADFFSIGAAAMTKGGKIFVVKSFCKKGVSPREQVDKIFEIYQELKARFPGIGVKVGIESIAYQRALIHLTREEMFRKHCYFEIEAITHGKTSKDDRIKGILQPRYANGYIVHEQVFPELDSQLLDYPNGKKDAPDAVAMAVALLDPYAAAAVGDKDLSEDEYNDADDVTMSYAP